MKGSTGLPPTQYRETVYLTGTNNQASAESRKNLFSKPISYDGSVDGQTEGTQ